LNELGKQHKIFVPEYVFEEIVRTEDNLSKWLKNSEIPVKKVSEQVANCLKTVYSSNTSCPVSQRCWRL
jgi:hypothetical protein